MTTATTSERRFAAWRKRGLRAVEGGLARRLAALEKRQPAAVGRLTAAMRHSLLGGGKRLRPLLALAAAEAVGGPAGAALPAALAVEMIHAYSLIHDDLPALDDDELRRGRPTCHKVFGEATAILAGDALQTLAFETLAGAGGRQADGRALRAVRHLARAAGAVGMAGGQAMDLAFENQHPAVGDVVDMEVRKTGELLAAALVCGALLAGAERVGGLYRAGLLAGRAFQIADDLLNQHGDPALLGKAVGSDAARGKASWPALVGRAEAETQARRLLARARRLTAGLPGETLYLGRLLDGLVDRIS